MEQSELKLFEPDIAQTHVIIQQIGGRILSQFQEKPLSNEPSPDSLLESLSQYFSLLEAIKSQDESTTMKEEMTDLGDYGLRILGDLKLQANRLGMEEEEQALTMLSIPVALLSSRHGFKLTSIENPTDAFSIIANHTQDSGQLSELSDYINEIINATADDLKKDVDKSNPGRPWRLLNLNQGIVATRSHDPDIMESVFQQLIYRLPDDAAAFFEEGMEQMDIVNYPEHVRRVMHKFYEQTHKPTLH